MSLKNFFLSTLALKKRTMTFTRLGSPNITATIIVHPASFENISEAAGNITVQGHEFIITKDEIAKIVGITALKKGDKLEDPELGIMTIKDPEPMYDLGGSILAFRCRTT